MELEQLPSAEYQKVIDVLRFLSAPLGANVLDPNWKYNWKIITTLIVVFSFLIFSAYTIFRMYDGDWRVILEVLGTLGSCVNGIAKIYSVLMFSDMYLALNTQLYGIYREYEQLGANYRKVMGKLVVRCRLIIRVLGIAYCITVTTIIVVPFIILLYNGKRHVILHFMLPKLDLESDFGYFANLTVQAVCVLTAGFGLYLGDLLVIIFLTHAILFTDILSLKVEAFNEKVDNDEASTENIDQDLFNLIRWHQIYDRYLTDCNIMNNAIISCTMVTAVGSCVNTLYLIMTTEWPGAYTYLLLSFIQLYSYSLLGTQTEICNDELSKEFYKIHFYNLTPSQQRLVKLMIRRSQTPRNIEIATVLPLTVSTGLRFTRVIYSSFMMMLQFG